MGTDGRRTAALALGCLLFGVACAAPIVAPVVPPFGGAFTMYSAPLETDFEATPIGSKVGTARMSHFTIPYTTRIPVATWAEAGIREAAADAGIQTVHYADYQLLNVLGIYVQLTVKVSGD